jgi:HK97 family phage prohead protease
MTTRRDIRELKHAVRAGVRQGLEPVHEAQLRRAIAEAFRASPAAALLAVRQAIITGFREAQQEMQQSERRLRFVVPIRHSTMSTRAASNGRRISFRASSPTIDRHGTRILSEGIDTSKYDHNPIVLWSHDYGSPFSTPSLDSVIGRTVSHSKSRASFDVVIEFAKHAKAEQALQMVREGVLSAVSVGFVPIEMHEERIGNRTVTVFDSVELLEISLVAVGSNPDALVTAGRTAKPHRLRASPIRR